MSFSSRKTRRDARVRSNRRTSPLRLEQLEARLVLSTFTVINTDDSGAGSLRQAIVAANANVGAAKALFFPAISLTTFLGGISGSLATLLGGSGAVWQAAPTLLQPVFTGGRLRGNLDAARASYDEAVAQYQKAALNGYREVADALITVQKLSEVYTERDIGVAALRNAANLSRTRYNNGLASYIEILTADQDLFAQQLQLAQTGGAELRARADLYRALGGGWQP